MFRKILSIIISLAILSIIADKAIAVNGAALQDQYGNAITASNPLPITLIGGGTSQWVDNAVGIGYTAGNVGVGTSEPAASLHVGATAPEIRVGTGTTADSILTFDGNAQNYYLGIDETDDKLHLGVGTTAGGNAKVVVQSDGNVGIGTTIPSALLYIGGGGAGYWGGMTYTGTPDVVIGSATEGDEVSLALTNHEGTNNFRVKFFLDDATSNYGFYITRSTGSNNFVIGDTTGEYFRIRSGGNVGIGTSTPTAKLYVSGDTYVTGNVSADSFTDRTPIYDGDAIEAIKQITGTDGQIDHSTLPSFVQKTIEKKQTVKTESAVEVSEEDAWEEYTETTSETVKNENGEAVVLSTKITYEAVDGEAVAKEEPVYQTVETVETKKRLKDGVTIDEETGKYYKKTVTEKEVVTGTEEGRDLGAMISVLTKAVQQLTERIEALEKQ